MVSVRFTGFVLMFILLHTRNSSANTNQAMEKMQKAAKGSRLEATRTTINVEKEFYDGVPAVAEVGKTRLGERRMITKRTLEKMMKEEGVGRAESKISGAASSVRNYCSRRGRGISNVECKLSNRSPHHMKVKKLTTAGFTAFSADYHVPKSHPPKNN